MTLGDYIQQAKEELDEMADEFLRRVGGARTGNEVQLMEIPKKAQGRPPGSRYAITGESRVFKCAKAKCTAREKKNICCAVRAWAKKAGEKVSCRCFPGEVRAFRCTCTMAQRMVGDGCEICNPSLAREIARENKEDGE